MTEPDIAPVYPAIVSASRRTDIPAFFSDWFFVQLEAGGVSTRNPFNGKPSFISFRDARAFVFWTKNPKPLLDRLPELVARTPVSTFQFTLNDYEREKLEPGLPSIEERIGLFRELAERLGPERVVWRFDPLILLPGVDVDGILERLKKLGDSLVGYTNRLVFSFIDVANYPAVRRRLVRSRPELFREGGDRAPGEFGPEEMIRAAQGLGALAAAWRRRYPEFRASACCERIDMSAWGIEALGCLDGELISRLTETPLPVVKDPGQRRLCRCVPSKDIGTYGTCRHGCLYCYATR